jgi:3-hydroxyisobutyrate dehydrogenase-like beta-hydroxyacid dehydrogenase
MNVVILHPGDMGVTIGAAALARAEEVRWVSANRSNASHERAVTAGLVGYDSVAAALENANFVFSVCPPHAASEVAAAVANCGYRGLFVDGNAISPESARNVSAIVSAGGARFVDGGIIGPPAHQAGTTRLYVCGDGASEVSSLFQGSPLDCRIIPGEVGAASALKMSYAAWAKGSSALLLGARALSRAYGVESALCEEWDLSRPDLRERSRSAASRNAFKAWRFESEMHEIADTFAAAGLPEGFHLAAADIFARLAGFKDQRDADPEAIFAALQSHP